MNKKSYIIISIIVILLLFIGILFSIFAKEDNSVNNSNNNLAKIEIYSIQNNELIKTINSENILQNYNRLSLFNEEDIEENQEELKTKVKELEEEYTFISYKFPVAKLGNRELEKIMTITLYKDSNIVKTIIDNNSVKSFSLPEKFLTFYYNISNEDLEFLYSLIEAN